ncbi:MAG TPA: VWA domain-containing protein [Terriglobia bacterium]|nr:VWA domain-containing protein [Terriglobia bacterium]
MLFLSGLLASAQSPERRQSPVKIDVDLVLVNAAVTDRDGRPVAGLNKSQFQVWEDKVQQDIKYFSTDELPASVGVIFDISGSMKDKLPTAREAVAKFLSSGTPEDEYALIKFANRPELAQQFTSNTTEFENRVALDAGKGSTALYDAVYLGLETLRHAHNPRKALLLVTDGEDNHSRYSYEDVKRLAMEADIQLYAIGMGGFTIPTMTKGHIPGNKILQQLVDLTGGQVFFTTDVQKLDEICERISESLKTEYVIGYASTNTAKDGKWRKLHVKVEPVSHASVHARSGYYAQMQ